MNGELKEKILRLIKLRYQAAYKIASENAKELRKLRKEFIPNKK